MNFFKKKQSILGLDLGKDSLKALRLDLVDGKCQIRSAVSFRPSAEGILDRDENERQKFLSSFLRENNLDKLPIASGLPQELTTFQVCRFPANVSEADLQKLVDREISQLAGLVDEPFVSDFCRLPDNSQTSVLIGLCRQSVTGEFAGRLTGQGLNLTDLTTNGIALVDSLFFLEKKAAACQGFQAILDIGSDTSTFVLLHGTSIIHVSSLMFGGDKFLQAYASSHACTADEAYELLSEDTTDPTETPDSAMLPVFRQLFTEITASLEQWQENSDQRLPGDTFEAFLETIWLSGGAIPRRLPDAISEGYNCECRLLCPELPGNAGAPEKYVTALGLALHASGQSLYRLPLLPPQLRWMQKRLANFPMLAAAYGILLVLLAAAFTRAYCYFGSELSSLESQTEELKRCAELVPKLDSAQVSMLQLQKTIVPLIEAGSRSRTFMQSFAELQRVKDNLSTENPDWWCFYLADEFSYAQSDYVQAVQGKKTDEPPAERHAPFGSLFPLHGQSQPAPSSDLQGGGLLQVMEMPLLSKMIVCGYIAPRPGKGRYEDIRLISDHLNNGTLFTGSDWFNDWIESPAAKQWNVLMHSRRLPGQYNTFVFNLPLKNLSVNRPAPASQAPSRRRSRQRENN